MGKTKINKNFAKGLERRLVKAANKVASDVQSELQNEAPWQDRTGEARQRLNVNVEVDKQGISIIASHGVDYGVYLEKANFGKFAVLTPYFDREAKNLVRRVINEARD